MQYAKWGHGSEVLIAFHGFGRNYTDFIPFTAALESTFTIYGFNLFFHGESSIGHRVPDKEPLQPAELAKYFCAFLESIDHPKAYFMGYSLGGRIALVLSEYMPERVAGLYLFAPDGLVINFWYAVSSFTSLGRAAFRFMIHHNQIFYKMLHFFNRLDIVSDKRLDFVLSQIKTTEEQWKVYNVWTLFRHFKPDFKQLSKTFRKHSISVDLFVGKYDTIIPPKNGNRFRENFPELNYCVIESGHAMLKPAIMNRLLADGIFQIPAQL